MPAISSHSNNSPMSLGTRSITELLVQYSIPAIIASVATSLYNIIDSIFIGRGVGPMAIAGLAITFPLMNLVAAFVMLIAAGAAAISSIYLGQKNIGKATDTVNNVFVLSLIHSVIFGSITYIFLDDILYFFGATPETIPYAREFMRVIVLATPISYVFIGLNNLMRATGYPKKAMISALLSVVVNLILAPIFIFVMKKGIQGAAWATVCGQTAACIWVLWHFFSKKSFIHFERGNKWFSWNIIKRIYAIGLSPFLMNVCSCVVVIFINRALLSYGGDNGNLGIGAFGILNRTTMFFVMIVFGVTQGMQPILGFNFGAGNWERVTKTLKLGIICGVSITTIGFLLTQLIPGSLSAMFTSDNHLIELANTGYHIAFLFFPCVGCQVIIQNFFQSIGKPQISIFLSLTRQLLFLVPLLIFLPRIYGINGVWASMAGSDLTAFIVAVVTLVIMLHIYKKKFKKTTLSVSDK